MTTTKTDLQSYSPQDSANLDFLRSVAVLLVFFTHWYDIANGLGSKWSLAWHLGQLGVLMFFVHTCLVLMWSLERSCLEGWRLFIAFYVRRIFRLYPLSIVCVMAAFLVDLRWQPPNLWSNLTLTQNLFPNGGLEVPPIFFPLWTLPLEVQMYLVLPVLFVIFKNRPARLLLASWMISLPFAILQPKMGGRFAILEFLPCFLGGVVAWRLMRNNDTRRLSGWLWPVAIPAISVLWMTARTEQFRPLHIAVFGLCLGSCVPLFKEIPWKGVQSVSKIVARYSYGIYLSHFPIQIYIFNNAKYHPVFKIIQQLPPLQHHSRLIHWSLFAVLSVLAPVLLYHCVEKPGIRLGHKLARMITSPGIQGALPKPGIV